MNFRKVLCATAVVCMSGMGAAAVAQSDRATLTGTVKDPSSAVVPGVIVRVVNVGTNDVQTTTTDSKGFYRLGNLPIGNYTVTFTHSGFKQVDKTGIVLLVSQTAQVNADLPLGGDNEVVSVSSAPPILQTEDTAVSTNLNGEAVTELPLNVQGSRNLSNFMFAYVPGVEGNDYNSHINGSVSFTKEVLIDGTSAVSQIGGYISESQPPFEAIQEFQADTAGISADAGRSGGGVFRYEMKSGTNQLHGSLFGFLHSTSLDAVSASNKLHAITDPANSAAYLRKSDSLSDWGGSIGGPIVKDKLFFFAAFERYMQSNWSLGANSRIVPTDAMMGLDTNGNFTQFADLSPMLTKSNVIGTDPCGNTLYQGNVVNPATNCAFVNNQIPTSMISKTTTQILALYHQFYRPQSTLPINEAGPAYSPDPWFHNTQSSIKIDYNLSERQHLNGSFYWDEYPRINADQGGVWSPTAQYGGPMANSYFHNTTAPGGRMSYAYTITPNLVNTVYATFNRFRNDGEVDGEEICGLGYGGTVEVQVALPSISSINPTGGTIGTTGTITVQGENLVPQSGTLPSASITGSDVTLTVQSASATQATVQYQINSQAATGSRQITLSTGLGKSNAVNFTVGDPPAVVTSLSPSNWQAGTSFTLTITGTGFGTAPSVSISGSGVTAGQAMNSNPAGTQTQVNVSVAADAPSQTVTVNVQPGNAGSSFTCNCNGSSPVGTDTATVSPVTPTPQIMQVMNMSDLANCANSSATMSGANETDVFAGKKHCSV